MIDVQDQTEVQPAAAFADERAIEALIKRSARLVDEQRFLEWIELFTEDGEYSAITRENAASNGLYLYFDAGKRMLHMRAAYLLGLWQAPRGVMTHLVSNLEIELIDDTHAKGVSSFITTRTAEMEHSTLYAAGRYLDRFEKVAGHWLFAKREVIVDSNMLPSSFTDLL